MNPANDVSWRGVASALVRSYVADLRAWAAKLAAGYSVAVAMLVAAAPTSSRSHKTQIVQTHSIARHWLGGNREGGPD